MIFAHALGSNMDNLDQYFTDPIPHSALSIFRHNLKFVVLYQIPFLGFILYLYSLVVISVALGFYTVIYNTPLLYHLPLEMFALTLCLSLSFSLSFSKRLQGFALATLCLLLASILEFYVR